MKPFWARAVIAASVLLSLVPSHAQQNGAPLPQPAPPVGPRPETMDGAVTKKEAANWNEMIVQARAATKEKRYADSEALMLQATRDNPNLILPWVELGLAQLGLKKYTEAENSFKIALGIDPASLQRAHNEDFYLPDNATGVVAPGATRASRNTNGGIVDSGDKRTPDILGTSYASLGEIYIRQGKAAEGENAFDTAVRSNPTDASLYRRNETIFFFQVGNGDEQLKAAEQAIAVDPTRAAPYYFKGQALVAKATVDPKTQKIVLPPGCAEAYLKYLALEPNGQFSADAKGVLAAAGVGLAGTK
jgi:tetratricopeptide (TPR) repeat protein